MKTYECWNDMEEAPDVGCGRMIAASSARSAAIDFANVAGDGDIVRVCVRDDGEIACFEVGCRMEITAREVEYKP